MTDSPQRVNDLQSINAVTLVTTDMARSIAFYVALGFRVGPGGATPEFTSLAVGEQFVNLQLDPDWTPPSTVWGRVIIWVDDVDLVFARSVAEGYDPASLPEDAPWGERYFHIRDPDGHELSFAAPLSDQSAESAGS